MLRTVLVDDEIASIHILKNLLSAHCAEVEVVGEADSVPAASRMMAPPLKLHSGGGTTF